MLLSSDNGKYRLKFFSSKIFSMRRVVVVVTGYTGTNISPEKICTSNRAFCRDQQTRRIFSTEYFVGRIFNMSFADFCLKIAQKFSPCLSRTRQDMGLSIMPGLESKLSHWRNFLVYNAGHTLPLPLPLQYRHPNNEAFSLLYILGLCAAIFKWAELFHWIISSLLID